MAHSKIELKLTQTAAVGKPYYRSEAKVIRLAGRYSFFS